jgi:GNAT superfamily N-acetyltransferase
MGSASTYFILTPEDVRAFDQMAAIYRSSIIPSEQKSASELAGMLSDPRYKIIVAQSEGRVIGFAISFFPACGTFWLLEYMAVDRTLRSRGDGRRLFLEAKRIAAQAVGAAPCILEVDQCSQQQPAGTDASRRLQFYRRLGCRRVSRLDYILPLDAAGAPPPMWLLVHGLEHGVSVLADDVAQWLLRIYADVYGKRADDPRLITMLSSLPGMTTLELAELP